MPEDIPFEKKELIITVHNPNHLPVIDFHELKELQGDLKITTPAKIEKLKNSIRKYGIFVPKFVWIDNGTYYIEDGHQTITALKELEKGGYTVPPIPCVEIQAKNRKDAAEKLLMINSRFADINPETSFFKDFDIGLEFMEEIEIPELELNFEGDGEEIVEDEVPEVPVEPVTQVGVLWLLDKHRVLCGDATKAEDAEKLMDGKKADVVFTDPPYGINLETNRFKNMPLQDSKNLKRNSYENLIGDNLKRNSYENLIGDNLKRNSYENLIGDDIPFDFTQFSKLEIKEQFWWGANHYCQKIPEGGTWFVWDKKKEGMEETLGGEFEVCWSKQTHKPKILRILWTGFLAKEKNEKRTHPTQKPIELATWFINKFSKGNTMIVDYFIGSGTTLIAAHQLNRTCYGMEIEPKYVDVACQRFFDLTGIDPIRESDGKKWSELQKEKLDKT